MKSGTERELSANEGGAAVHLLSTWQPIESAPRDGTLLLLTSPEGFVGVGFIRAHRYSGLELEDAPAAWAGTKIWERRPSVWIGGHNASEATHWMPLPDPPGNDAQPLLDSPPDQRGDVMGLSLRDALRGRQIAQDELAEMSPQDIFAEWCGWNLGDPSWGVSILKAWKECQALADTRLKEIG